MNVISLKKNVFFSKVKGLFIIFGYALLNDHFILMVFNDTFYQKYVFVQLINVSTNPTILFATSRFYPLSKRD